MSDRRSFLRHAATLLGGAALHPAAAAAWPGVAHLHRDTPDDDFWRQVRLAFAASPTLVNLNNGGVCPAPRASMDALDYYNRMCNEAPSYYMWRILDQDREPLRAGLADLAGVDPEEIAINRNATEALNTVIFGLPLQTGDEVVLSRYDYPNMMNAWKQREAREGIKLVWVEDLPLPSENALELETAYTRLFTPRTKVVHLTHVINWCGQILPVRRIADKARALGILVLVDAAHSFALLDVRWPELGADYIGTSLHKWLCAPFGSGMLYVRKARIADLWPLLSHPEPGSADIRKFESLGTRSFPIEMAIGYSLDFHHLIGGRRKQERLQFLKNYWMEQVRDLPGFRSWTSMHPDFGCAIATIGFDGRSGSDLGAHLMDKHKIHTVPIQYEKIDGVRITPNVYTMPADLDKLVTGIRSFARQ